MNLQLTQVPKSYRPEKACVYSIVLPNYLNLSKLECLELIKAGDEYTYVGVTTNIVSKRVSDNRSRKGPAAQRSTPFLKMLKEQGYDFEDFVRILAEGELKDMLLLEKQLRPRPNMGLNSKVGGC